MAMWDGLEFHPDLEAEGGWFGASDLVNPVQEGVDQIYEALEIKLPWWRRALS
jgi:hypothetical protein